MHDFDRESGRCESRAHERPRVVTERRLHRSARDDDDRVVRRRGAARRTVARFAAGDHALVRRRCATAVRVAATTNQTADECGPARSAGGVRAVGRAGGGSTAVTFGLTGEEELSLSVNLPAWLVSKARWLAVYTAPKVLLPSLQQVV